MSETTIHIKFFGAFRQYGDGADITLTLPNTVETAKKILQEKLGGTLVSDSVFANDNRILRDGDVIGDGVRTLSILPPVCGG